MAAPYSEPPWGAPLAAGELSLDVIRGGTQLETVPLSGRSYFLLGRKPEWAHVHLRHESCSRLHAVVQLGGDQAFVMDCGSAHGTKKNREPLPPREYVPLQVGDMLQFGGSSREYVVDGPDELRPPEEALPAAPKPRLAQKRPRARTESAGGGDVTWGMDMDDAPQSDDDEDEGEDGGARPGELPAYLRGLRAEKVDTGPASSLEASEVHERDQRFYEQLQRKEAKRRNLANEMQRILNKETSGELTDGQRRQVDKNTKAIEQLEEQIAALEDKIRGRNRQRSSSSSSSGGVARRRGDDDYDYDDDNGVDDFFDRAGAANRKKKRQKQSSESSGAAGEEAFTLESLQKRQQQIEARLAEMQRLRAAYAQQAAAQAAAADPDDALDAFMASNNVDNAQHRLEALDSEREQLLAEQGRVAALVKIATPALPPPVPAAGASAVAAVSTASAVAGASAVAAAEQLLAQTLAPVKAPRERPAKAMGSTAAAAARLLADSAPPPAPASPPPAAAPAPAPAQEKPPTLLPAPAAKEPELRPGLQLRKKSAPPPAPAPAQQQPQQPQQLPPDDSDITWRPPAGQTGDGRTALNDKLGY